MRRILLFSLLFAAAGCQGLRDHAHCKKGNLGCATTEPCPEKKVKSEPPKVTTAPPTELAVPTISQDILLVPVTSYVPYARTTPTGPVRMTLPPNVTTPAPPNVGEDKPKVTTPPPAVDKETVKELLKICEKQCERIDHLEKCIRERHAAPPPPVCPPPLLRRPLFNRCEPLFPRCEPMFQKCEPLVPCDPAGKKSSVTPSSSPPEVQPSVLTIH